MDNKTENNNIVVKRDLLEKAKNAKFENFEFDLLNAIYVLLEKSLLSREPIRNNEFVDLEFSITEIKEVLNISCLSDDLDIEDGLRKLFSTELKFENVTDPIDGEKYKILWTRIIFKYGLLESSISKYLLTLNASFLINFLKYVDKRHNSDI